MSRRDEVLQAALDLLDEVGLDALTTRRLADKLGVRPGALYRHFASKQELLTAMVADLLGGGAEPATGSDWPELVRGAAHAARSMMLTRRDGARLVISHVASTVDSQRAWLGYLRLLTGGGLGEQAATVAIDTVFAYVNGFTMEEQTRDDFPQTAAQRARRDEAFTAGVELIVAGIAAQLPAR